MKVIKTNVLSCGLLKQSIISMPLEKMLKIAFQNVEQLCIVMQ